MKPNNKKTKISNPCRGTGEQTLRDKKEVSLKKIIEPGLDKTNKMSVPPAKTQLSSA